MVVAIKTRQRQHGFQHMGGHERGILTTGWRPSRCRKPDSHAETCRTTYHGNLTEKYGERGGELLVGLHWVMDAGLTVPSSMATRCNVCNDEEGGRCDTASITAHYLAWRRQTLVKCSRTARRL